MSDPKTHHVVPRCVLKNFADDDGLLHCYDKARKTHYATSPSKAFRQKNLYAYMNQDGTKSLGLERWVANLESHFCRLVEKLLRAARRSKRQRRINIDLSDHELDVARVFCALQFLRTPAKHRHAEEFWDREIDELIRKAADKGDHQGSKDSTQKLKKLQSLKNDRHFSKNEWLTYFLEFLQGDGYTGLSAKGLVLGLVKNPRQQAFVIGDNPVIQSFPSGSTLPDPEAEIIMPIASDVALFLKKTSRCRRVWLYNRKIREFNEYIFERSDAIASRSEAITKPFSSSV